ncbi:MAG: OmpA family protein [Deltaproteobacteria bacterium]|nr:MAG: OmpA family protein [Deltaproteobacteria bacterium]
MRSMSVVLLGVTAWLLGCASAYERTYEQETQRLERQRQAREQREAMAHAEASRYAAVVYFEVGSAVIHEDGHRELRWFAEKLEPYPQAVILVQGFADATGGDGLNQELSEERASNVADVLVTQGIAASRLRVSGFASDYAAESNDTRAGRSRNRRVEVTVQ